MPASLFSRAAKQYNRFCCRRGISHNDYTSFVTLLEDKYTGGPAIQAHLAALKHPIWVRPKTPDATEITHTILREAYGKYLPSGPIQFIIDAGAYIGDATCWYLSKYPGARVVALEPNPETFAALSLNCAPYGQQVRLIQAGLWYRDEWVQIIPNESTPTGISIAPCSPGATNSCPAVSPSTILVQERVDKIDIFKIDIEGAEETLFSVDSDSWLSRTRSIFVEIHSPQAYGAVSAATQKHGFLRHQYRELFIYSKQSV